MKKKREYQASELVQSLARIYGFEEKLLAFEIKDFLKEYLDSSLFNEVESVQLNKKELTIKINSSLVRNDLRMRKTFFLNKFQTQFGEDKISALQIL